MTGFGRAQGPLGRDWTAEIVVKAVNHRFLDLTVKARETEASLEPIVRRALARHVSRGKVEVALRVRRISAAGHAVTVDEGLLEALLDRFAALSKKYRLAGALEARDLLAIPQIVSVESALEEFAAEETAALEALAEEAARGLVAMREAEGDLIRADLSGRIETLQAKTQLLEERREEIARRQAEILRERVKALFPDVPLDSGRIEQEAALAADRSDVSEELQRLSGHLEQFAGLLEKPPGPAGKRLEFLSQEILRELNTLGSKARDLSIIREVLDMKSETEKIREQVLNVE
ncbi:MAG: YicC/YloC family endoribonuclease [Thermoanaerobaculia bacterium]